MRTDPFAALGLPSRAGLSDDDVRAAWRRIAASTHPDREDGGDLARYSAAAAAYDMLRTSFGRGEALADLAGHARRRRAGGGHARRDERPLARATARLARRLARPVAAGRARRLARPMTGGQARVLPPGSTARRRLTRRLAGRTAAAVIVTAAAVFTAGWTPATVGVLVGVLTWLAVTGLPGHGER